MALFDRSDDVIYVKMRDNLRAKKSIVGMRGGCCRTELTRIRFFSSQAASLLDKWPQQTVYQKEDQEGT